MCSKSPLSILKYYFLGGSLELIKCNLQKRNEKYEMFLKSPTLVSVYSGQINMMIEATRATTKGSVINYANYGGGGGLAGLQNSWGGGKSRLKEGGWQKRFFSQAGGGEGVQQVLG